MHLLTIHAIYYRIKKVICTNNGAQKATPAMRICVFCCFSKMLFLVQKPLASDNETVPGEGQFQDKTWKEVIEEILTKNDISADKIALGNKNIVTEEDLFFNGDTQKGRYACRKRKPHKKERRRMISIIVPCYNEEEALPIFYQECSAVLSSMNEAYELLFVNDGSKDGTLSILKELSETDACVRYLSFSRNFGKESAMFAGFCNAKGDYVAVMDADMQDPPSLLPQMLEILRTGEYDSVATRRVDRAGEPPLRSWFARQFYKLINRISDADVVDGARDFRLMRREMVDAILSMSEYNRFSKGIFGWVGFRTYWLPYENVERVAGQTKWSFWKLFKYAVDGIINFSQTPLSAMFWFGMGMVAISILVLIFLVVRRAVFGDPVAGWASTICVIIFIGGMQTFFLGVMGQYIAKTYMETKHRPHYIVSETNVEEPQKIR